MQLFSEDDIEVIANNLNDIMDRAMIKQRMTIEPSINTYNDIKKITLEWLKKKKRIMYGGFAWNLLIEDKDPKLGFYRSYETPDMDFYSNDPINDIKELCDLFMGKKYQYIQATDAFHTESYKIFINFTEYINISYMPSNVYFSVPTLLVDGIKIFHPKMLLIDILRQYNDPINSVWRIQKNFFRGNILLDLYPLELKINKVQSYYKKLTDKAYSLGQQLFDFCSMTQDYIFCDYNVGIIFEKPQPKKNIKLKYEGYYIELMANNLYTKSKDIYNYLLKIYKDKMDLFDGEISIKQYHPFFQYTSRNVKFYYKEILLLSIYENNNVCRPYQLLKTVNDKEIMVMTFNFFIMNLLINIAMLYASKHNDHLTIIQQIDNLLAVLIDNKHTYLKSKKETILDDNIYEDFKAECFGKTSDLKTSFMISNKTKKYYSKHSRLGYYNPNDRNSKIDPSTYSFNNSSGNIITSSKLFSFDETTK